jgi:hypothetical protein
MENLKNLSTQTLRNKQKAIRNTIKMVADNEAATDFRVSLTKKHNEISRILFIRLQDGTY